MAAVEVAPPPAETQKTDENGSPDSLADAVASLAINQDKTALEQDQGTQHADSYRPLRIYTRKQLLHLHASPLVQVPTNMPELKDWFGTENEQSLSKKEDVASPPRERRFRRDPEDGDTPSRPSFRSTVSQPSQMGNFKHQSLRSDRDRDERDREGIRNMSERYDRDRMGLGLNGRNKDRDVAPHLSSAPSARLTSAGQLPTLAARRGERGETGRKKAGDEDWRRGSEPGRRDDRERQRSRVRDSSRPRREQSATRRDRDDRRDRKDDRDYEDSRNHRRPKDEDDPDDPRRWRDDGKRDERIASRRDRFREERAWDDRRDRGDRWTVVEERDARSKRGTGRDRRNGDDPKDRDERKDRSERDRDHNREKEKEPAWMDTYIPPPTSGAGILGAKTEDGELDGIQAWKKGMKEKEMKEKGAAPAQEPSSRKTAPAAGGNGLDEIQLFRMMMKKEDDKKKMDGPSAEASPTIASVAPARVVEALPAASISVDTKMMPQTLSSATVASTATGAITPSSSGLASLPPKPEVHLEDVLPATSRLFPRQATATTSAEASPLESAAASPTSALSPPAASRLLSFARAPVQAKGATGAPGSPANGIQAPQPSAQPSTGLEAIRRDPAIVHLPNKPGSAQGSAYSPFEDPTRASYGFEDGRRQPTSLADQPMRVPANNSPGFNEPTSADGPMAGMRGSRFAKFFDGKPREGVPKMPGMGDGSPVGLGRQQEPSPMNIPGSGPDGRAMDEIFAMLNSSATHPPPRMPNPPAAAPSARDVPLSQQAQLAILQQQGIHPSRLESFYDSRFDDRSFVPDGMVPGLRSAPPPRDKGPAMFADAVDDPHFSVQRPPHQRGADPAFWNQPAPRHPPPQQMYGQQVNARGGMGLSAAALQQQQFRGGPSPLTAQAQANLLQQSQRLPPGLANLGGRPPHDPSQFIGIPGMQNSGLHGSAALQTNFNGLPGGNNVPFGGPQLRSVPSAQQLHNAHHPLSALSHQELELRAAQAQLMGMGGGGGHLRGLGGGLPTQHQISQQAALLNLRAQQQQQQQQHLAHGLPPHVQQQHAQPTPEDLMQLLLAGRGGGGGPDLDSFSRYR
ncbi:hypothetical protein BD626DRAFT_566441 [Schizophyllum amplum]|uniref:Uncharacterized protein n=1 Tax=Schizophyllum amplum TaxID=97359 RepID=A0A550CLU7_9AGAR|nr:hypothetical protein BD626DRAFT_566441 [Auriculariopsis ampla]